MKITDVKVRVFTHQSRLVKDSDGHTHPGDAHRVKQALLTIIADDGSQGHCLSPVEVVRPHLIDGFVDWFGQSPTLLGKLFRPVQNGLVQFYALAMVLGLTVFLLALAK